MANSCNDEEPASSSTGVFELCGEPATVINGLPPVDNTLVLCDTKSDAESTRNVGYCEWLEGREVKKRFGNQIYSGLVTKFDKETGWYRVDYEDGDFEDLEWHELEEILEPMDITIPLKTLALKIIRRTQKPIHQSGQNGARPKKRRAKKSGGGKGKAVDVVVKESSMMELDTVGKIIVDVSHQIIGERGTEDLGEAVFKVNAIASSPSNVFDEQVMERNGGGAEVEENNMALESVTTQEPSVVKTKEHTPKATRSKTALEASQSKGKQRKCGLCGETGHYMSTCKATGGNGV